ncbi:hypothetical protein B0H16DRAFT_1896813 [Mycena metata]|uniref:Zn(2)-C6 fungal-type domain-containing protein n=1 Tax=Mycena metata TaxID=1033252 RepID=A0AAD7HIJ1_9AGAR|nr:hypothetical protein B0H16DRAFT_1896813 [Mycena metata]
MASASSPVDVEMPPPDAEKVLPPLPPDYWGALRDVPFAELYKITDLEYRDNMKVRDIRTLVTANKEALAQSIKDNEPFRHNPDFPLELLYLYEGLTPVAKELDPDRKTLAVLHANFTLGPDYQAAKPKPVVPDNFTLPPTPLAVRTAELEAERELRRQERLKKKEEAKAEKERAAAAAKAKATVEEEERKARAAARAETKAEKGTATPKPVPSASGSIKRKTPPASDDGKRAKKSRAKTGLADGDATASAYAPPTAGASKSKFSGPRVVEVPATEGPPIKVKLGPHPASFPKILATDSCGEEGWPIEQGRRTLINQQRAVPMVRLTWCPYASLDHADRVKDFFRTHKINRDLMLKIMDLLPSHAKTDDGKGGTTVKLSALTKFLKVSPPTDGVSCDSCQRSGRECHSNGYPLPCHNCTRLNQPGDCSLTWSAEVLNVAANQFSKFSAFGSTAWEASIEDLHSTENILEDLQRSYRRTQLEHNYRKLIVLKTILQARQHFDKTQFLSHFNSDAQAMEETLRIAMVQGLTARTKITRQYVWRYYNGDLLSDPIPKFGTAYEFYRQVDSSSTNIPGYFYLDRESDEPAMWVPLVPEDFDKDADDSSIGPNGNRVFRRIVNAHRPTKDSPTDPKEEESNAAEDARYEGHMPHPPVRATGILAEVARGNLTLHDLMAIESTEDYIAAEEFNSDEEELGGGGEDDEDEESGSGSEESESDSDTPLSARRAARRKSDKAPARITVPGKTPARKEVNSESESESE